MLTLGFGALILNLPVSVLDIDGALNFDDSVFFDDSLLCAPTLFVRLR